MGAWGFRNFENDDAGDWVVYFMRNPNWDFIKGPIVEIMGSDNMKEEVTLAAIESIAIYKGNPPIDYFEVDFNLGPAISNLPPIGKDELSVLRV